MPDNPELATDQQREAAFRTVILLYSAMSLLAAAMTWFLIPDSDDRAASRPNPLVGMRTVLDRPVVWAQAIVIICAYCGFKGLDNYTLYGTQVLGLDEVQSQKYFTWGSYLRPVAAVVAGLIADRFSATRSIGVTFALLATVFVVLGYAVPAPGSLAIIYGNLAVTFFAVFALRGVYFALLAENMTPRHVTGATVGIVSFLGYTPDVFFAPITGRILDANAGLVGFQHYFLFLAGVSVVGVLATLWLVRLHRLGREQLWPRQTGPTAK